MSSNLKSNNFNTGENPSFQVLDIGHPDYAAVISPDSAFWCLSPKDGLGKLLLSKKFNRSVKAKLSGFLTEMETLRYGLKPSAVYFNPTERCNLNCGYCYIPEKMRKSGIHMDKETMFKSFEVLKSYFKTVMPENRKPSVIFHGSEPMLNKDAMFAVIKKYGKDFDFGIQSNATLIDEEAAEFIVTNNVGLGISLDGPSEKIANSVRRDWDGAGYYDKVINVAERFKDYERFNVICTVTRENLKGLKKTVDFFHASGIRVCMLNILRCTQERSRPLKPDDASAAKYFIDALERTHELYKKTGRKLIVANFANILLAILAPSARRLMCDISPCGGGRCFFAVSAKGDMFPCSEFIGLPEFNGGNIFKDRIADVLKTEKFKKVSQRRIEDIEHCKTCAIRHFCGSPCPAEAYTMNGGLEKRGAFCEFYEEQARYAFRLIADGRENDFLYDNWDKGTNTALLASDLTL